MSASRTVAIVVGVGDYPSESSWRLPGAAADAAHVTVWLLRRGVPPSNILLFLSPKPTNVPRFLESTLGEAVPEAAGCTAEDANEATIMKALRKRLRKESGDVLFMFWAGHGIADRKRVRHLLFADADASDWLNLPVDTLLESLRSDFYNGGFKRQIFCFDACSRLHDERVATITLSSQSLTIGAEQTWREQTVLYASSFGDDAVETDGRGLFTTALIEQLQAAPSAVWPPDMKTAMAGLAARFTSADPWSAQAPTMWRFIGADNDEFASASTPAGEARRKPRVESIRRVDRGQQMRTVGAFLTTATIAAQHQRAHAVILFGNEGEGHDLLVERVVGDHIEEIARKVLKIRAKPPTRSLPWTGDGEDFDELRQELVRTMFAAATRAADQQNLGAGSNMAAEDVNDQSAAALLRRLQVGDSPLVVLHQKIYVARWNGAQRDLLRWYLDEFWNPPPGEPSTPHILLFLKLVCDATLSRPSVSSWIKRHLSPKQHMSKDLEAVAASSAVGCRRALLKELLPVPDTELKHWFYQEEIDQWVDEDKWRDAINKIFTVDGKRLDCASMGRIRKQLTELIDPQRKAS